MGKFYKTKHQFVTNTPFYRIENDDDNEFLIVVWNYPEVADSILDFLNQDNKDLEKTVPTNG